MSWTTCIILCAVALAIWLAATIAEHVYYKKHGGEHVKPSRKKDGVFYGNREYNNDRYKQY